MPIMKPGLVHFTALLGFGLSSLFNNCPVALVIATQIGDGVCDPPYLTSLCAFDGQDCASQCSCNRELLGNGVCDSGKFHLECRTQACGWDLGDCGFCSMACNSDLGFKEMVGDGRCDEACNTVQCGFDKGDCGTSAAVEVEIGTNDSLEQTLADILVPIARIRLGPGLYPLKGASGHSRSYILQEVEISASYCPDQSLCEDPTLQITNQTSPFIITGHLTLKHVTIQGGFSLVQHCERQECTYCPAVTTDSEGNWVNDKGDKLTKFAAYEDCSRYHNFTLFSLYPDAHFFLENVRFDTITQEPKSLIYSQGAFLTFLQVTFSQLIMRRNSSDSAVITHQGPAGSIYIEDSLVQYLNNWHEYDNYTVVSGFLRVTGANKLTLNRVNFRQNSVLGAAKALISLIDLANVGSISVFECIFRSNFVTAGLLQVAGWTNTLNVQNSSFEYNLGAITAAISFATYRGNYQVVLKNCTFRANAVILEAIISFTETSNDAESIELDINAYLGLLVVSKLLALDNSGPYLLFASNISSVSIENLTSVGNGDIDHSFQQVFRQFTSDAHISMSILPDFRQEVCIGTLQIANFHSFSLHNSTFNSSSCIFGSPALTLPQHISKEHTTEVGISGLVLARNQGEELISLHLDSNVTLSQLYLENNTNLRTGKAVCLHFSASVPVSITVIDSVFLANQGLQNTLAAIEGIWHFTLTNVHLINNSAEGTSAGIVLFPYTQQDSLVQVLDCSFSRNSARSNGVLSLVDMTGAAMANGVTIQVVIEGCEFDSNFARFAGGCVTIAGFIELEEDSEIGNSVFRNNSCLNAGAVLSFRGFYTLLERQDFNPSEALTVRKCVFLGNFGMSVIDLTDIDLLLRTENCRFENSTGTTSPVRITSGDWRDSGSVFRYNQGVEAGVALLISGATFSGNGTMFLENWSETRGGAMVIWMNSQANCTNCVFESNVCETYGGAIAIHEYGEFAGQGVLFQGNIAHTEGSVVYSSLSTFECADCRVEANWAESYTVVLLRSSVAVFTGGLIRNNQAALSRTPGFSLSQSRLQLLNCSFANQTGYLGAFILASDYSTLTVLSSQFDSGIARTEGGCFYSIGTSAITVVDSTFTDCYAEHIGNIIIMQTGKLRMTNVTLVDIGRHRSAGAIVVRDSSIELEIACLRLQGSAVSAYMSTVVVRNSAFRDLVAYYGAAVSCSECPLVQAFNSQFHNCQGKIGGAVYIFTSAAGRDDYRAEFEGCRFSSNGAANGGAVYTESVQVYIRNCTFSSNSAYSSRAESVGLLRKGIGGALYLSNTYTERTVYLITNNTFRNNTATTMGGVLYWLDNYPSFESNLMEANSAPYGSHIASFPIRLALLDSNNLPVPYLNNHSIPQVLSITAVASGQSYPHSIRLALFDQYDQIVTSDSTSFAQFQSEGEETGLGGRVQVSANRGIFEFNVLTFIGRPKQDFDFFILSDGVNVYMKNYTNDPHAYHPKVSVHVTFRDCQPGESYQGLNCYLCQANTFSLTPSQPCNSCPSFAICYGGFNLAPKAGYWRPDPSLNLIFQCRNHQACLGSPQDKTLSLTGHCAEGYEGNLCAVCVRGYSLSGKSTCLQCPTLRVNIAVSCLLGLTVFGLLTLAICLALRGTYKLQSRMGVYMKILVNFLQLLAVVSSLDVSWPSFVSTFLDVQYSLGNVAEQLFSVSCILQEIEGADLYISKLAIVIILPAALIAIFACLCLILALCRAIRSVKDKVLTSAVVILFVLHPSVTKTLLSGFSCREIRPGEYWLSADLSKRCWSPDHNDSLLSMVLPGLIVWCIGLPSLCLIAMIRARNHLMSSSVCMQFSFLFKGYTPKHFYWEFVIVYRKMALICSSVFFSLVSTMAQALSVLAILLVYLSLQVHVKPFFLPGYHHLELKSLLASLVTLYVGLYFESHQISISHIDTEISAFLFALILIANAYFLVSWSREVCPLLVDTIKKRLRRAPNSQQIRPNDSAEVALEVVSSDDIVLRSAVVFRHSTA